MEFGPSAAVVRFYYPTETTTHTFYFSQESESQSDNIPKALIAWHTDCINSLSTTAATYRDLKSAAPMSFKDEAGLSSQLKPNTDGLIRSNQNNLAVASPKNLEIFSSTTNLSDAIKTKSGLDLASLVGQFSLQSFHNAIDQTGSCASRNLQLT